MGLITGFQEKGSFIMYELMKFMDFVNFFIIYISLMVIFMIIFILFNDFHSSESLDSDLFETIWLFLPIFVMFFISTTSMYILYYTDSFRDYDLNLKILGNQWYWSYEYNLGDVTYSYDSYMSSDTVEYRLLEVDNRVMLPVNTVVRMLISSSDVIHSFTIPCLGVKMDAIPGRINYIIIEIFKCGLFYGQCSEICGINHSFMPIVVECISMLDFLHWFSCLDC
uniref:cytochrome c oxidase subunit II n=1 Tax=Parasacculina yatsui TaxID=2836420 RepID=UPI002551EF68|nr:cytochrome c oxidase subunit II [Parasacculina yatsui]WGU20845.1 cytochrome c oxidase subunit II [Parasacculina yatsui]